MKGIKFFLTIIVVIVVAVSSGFLINQAVETYQEYKNPIYSGKRMYIIRNEGNPFEKQDTTFIKILEVKGDYVLYERSFKGFKDTSSSRISYIRHYNSL